MMRSAHTAVLPKQDGASIARQAEAYLASLPEITGEDLKTVLADGMVLVSGLLCDDADNSPARENHRKLASLVVAKMQRITRESSLHGKHESFPCFTS